MAKLGATSANIAAMTKGRSIAASSIVGKDERQY
jgi:hypothetical protein